MNMKLIGEDFIDLLYRCEDDNRVVMIREALGVDRPILGKKFKEDGYVSIENHQHRLELFFSDIATFNADSVMDLDCPILFSGVHLYYRTDIPLPFGLKMDDSLEDIVKILGRYPDYSNKHLPTKTWVMQRDDGKKYLLYADFDEDDLNELVSVDISTYGDNIHYLIKSSSNA